ncbi:MAG: nucleotidyltransferase family protein [Pirellulaceae bacterium]|nr:nucleotidyltransferase family protein [Pirellulaceae bacterium]
MTKRREADHVTDSRNRNSVSLALRLPLHADVLLLRSILWSDSAAREAWEQWGLRTGDPKAYFQNEMMARKGLLPLISQAIRDNRITVDENFSAYTRAAQLREQLRNEIFTDILKSVHLAMHNLDVDPLLIGGSAYAYSTYKDHALRHNHGIDLVVVPAELTRARSALFKSNFRAVHSERAAVGLVDHFVHRSGLTLTMRSTLFAIPHVRCNLEAVLQRSHTICIEERSVRILSPNDRLSHTLIETATSPSSHNLRWVCDSFKLLSHSSDRPNLLSLKESAGVNDALSLIARLLDYLHQQLHAPVDPSLLQELLQQGEGQERRERNFILSAGLRSRRSGIAFLKHASTIPQLLPAAIGFAVLPSRQHLFYESNGRRNVPVSYLLRAVSYPIRFVRQLGSAFRGWIAGSRQPRSKISDPPVDLMK